MKQRTLTLCSAVALFASFASADAAPQPRKRPIRTQSIAEAGSDWRIQGDYIGRLERNGEQEMFGVQVVALGDGHFKATGYHGGLPGAGWDRAAKIRYGEGATEDGVTTLEAKGGVAPKVVIADGRMKVLSGDKNVGDLVRVIRKSHTLGKKPPEGALVLFDGSSAEAFYQRRGEKPAEMTESGLLELSRGSGGLHTRKKFGDCMMHLEFRLPFEPRGRGQGRANSGCYLQGRYEVQILDSFGLEGAHNECGGIYMCGNDPEVNMCFPPLTWQTYDIWFTTAKYDKDGKKTANAMLTVYHNGVLVYAHQQVKDKTTAAPNPEAPHPEGHYLQDHGHELHYRNIWVVEN